MRLSLEQGRVIGSLIEKQLTTPQQYPLSLNALVAACNQSSNRDPVVRYDDGTVQRALASLKDIGLVRFIYPSRGGSATRYRQVLDEYLGIGQEALGLIAVLLLRGPQTAAELRSRTERMARLGGIAANAELERMAHRPEPLVRRLARRPGQKEERWVQLLTPAAPTDSYDSPAGGTGADRAPELESRMADLEEAGDDELPEPKGSALRVLADEVNVLRAEVAALRVVVEQLQTEEASRRAAVEQIRARLSP
ncbi:MAG: YceH family protein [Acidimicrobiales bacterium]|jgi:uncharacterized protein YceH (UPF0502 family)